MPRQWISSSSPLRLASKLECLLLRTTTGIQRGPQKREDQLRRRLQRGGRSQGRRSLFFSGTRRWPPPPPFFATTESDFPHRPNEENRRADDEVAGGGGREREMEREGGRKRNEEDKKGEEITSTLFCRPALVRRQLRSYLLPSPLARCILSPKPLSSTLGGEDDVRGRKKKRRALPRDKKPFVVWRKEGKRGGGGGRNISSGQ